MTDPPADDGAAVGGDGDFLTVEQMAQLRRVTPAAIRAQLRAGTLAGHQVLQGQRTVWRIPAGAARRSPETSGGSPPRTPRDPEAARSSAPATPSVPQPVPSAPGREAPTAPAAVPSAPVPSARLEALESEVRRLRRQLSALAEAHRRLLDALTADLHRDAPG
ncbi:hypothetical protein [Geodermatophilus sp. CPCC 205761]|uniref:hypothetical protein n=1 Tax=Geodermatophilus sp. CPCC 205761 TaxID=2936597 RepID=UPI003EEAEF26